MPCDACNKNIAPSSRSLACVVCQSSYHEACAVKSTQKTGKNQTGKDKTGSAVDWKCDKCLPVPQVRECRAPGAADDGVDPVHERDGVNTDLHKIFDKLEQISIPIGKIDSIENSLNFMSNKVYEFNGKIESILSKFNIQENRTQDLELKCGFLEHEITLLKSNANILEQHNLGNCLEIAGVPKTENESLNEIVNAIYKCVSLYYEPKFITRSYRTRGTERTESKIVLCFQYRYLKDNLVTAVKNRSRVWKKPLFARDLCAALPEQRIYINDHLSSTNKKLFWLAKKVGYRYGYKSVWTNSSGVYWKKDDGSVGERVSTFSQLMSVDVERNVSELWQL